MLTLVPILLWVMLNAVDYFLPFLDRLDAVVMPIMLAVLMTTLSGWITEVKARRLAFSSAPCPGCQKNLNYLVTDPTYSKRPPWGLPPELTKDVRECPYCGLSFEKD